MEDMEKQKRHLGIQTVSKKDIDRNTDEEIDTENALRNIQTINEEQTVCVSSY